MSKGEKKPVKRAKLIPVLELNYHDTSIEAPPHPYWQYPDEWDVYRQTCFERAGFKATLKPFEPGAFLYEIEQIPDASLLKIAQDHTEDLRNGTYTREEACALFGGYVLHIEGENIFYPQCCGDLSDIQFWRNISQGKQSYYEGHPAPIVRFDKDNVHFALTQAIREAEAILMNLAQKLQQFNEQEKWQIARIDNLLIRENGNYT